jgi:hypothetical protein|tara:strand:+ start:5062 stop:5301 length:240 start_codon:yes stop_codon:yes gene_type:complete
MKTKSFLTDEVLEDLITLLDMIPLTQSKREVLSYVEEADIKPKSDKKKIAVHINRISSPVKLQKYLLDLRLKHDGLGVL